MICRKYQSKILFKERKFLERFLSFTRKIIPSKIFKFFQPWYHGLLALSGAIFFLFPSRKIKVIGVTGTKGKSTTVFLITKFLEEAGYKVGAIGSLGYKIGEKEWPNNLKMTMPGRWKIQKFLAETVKKGCQFAVLEVTSEGIKQKRHWGINFDTAVFTNLEKEHIESHGSFEKYYQAKQELFKKTKNIHILNIDSSYLELFSGFSAKKKIFYGIKNKISRFKSIVKTGEILGPKIYSLNFSGINFEFDGFNFHSNLIGEFNLYNILAAIAVVKNYGVGFNTIQMALNKIKAIPGRMEFIETGQPFRVVVDYAHTPESLIQVYQTLKSQIFNKPEVINQKPAPKLICVLGAAGGGRDKWKRPVLGEIASKYCDKIILTNEDPYNEDPEKIIEDIEMGIKSNNCQKIVDRKKAIEEAIKLAKDGDIVVITGKGSETSMMFNNKSIPWSDKEIVIANLEKIGFYKK